MVELVGQPAVAPARWGWEQQGASGWQRQRRQGALHRGALPSRLQHCYQWNSHIRLYLRRSGVLGSAVQRACTAKSACSAGAATLSGSKDYRCAQ